MSLCKLLGTGIIKQSQGIGCFKNRDLNIHDRFSMINLES